MIAYIEANAEQVEQTEAEFVALLAEGVDLCLVLLDGLGEGLLGFAVFELSKVESSDFDVSGISRGTSPVGVLTPCSLRPRTELDSVLTR